MKPRSIGSVIAATCALAFSALSSSAGEGSEGKAWREIATGAQSNIEEVTRRVIQDREQWRKWWKEHNTEVLAINGEAAVAAPVPEVDFEKETVLVATLGRRSTGGFAIRFTGIRREDGLVTATLKSTSPGPDDMVTMALTSPFAVIAIPKHEGRVEFVGEK